MTVTVLDMNDNTPVFNASSYFKSIPEDIGMSADVTTVYATDQDDNNNGNVKYYLLNFEDVFLMNEDTGKISTVTDLDHEEDSEYIIVAQACDGGKPSLCSNTTVTVQVTDINDLSPTFDYDTYYTTICDDATPVTDVLQVIALDGDSGDNGRVRYSLASGSDLGSLFTLNEDSGQIKLVEDIPQSNIDTTLIVSIVAEDGGSQTMTGKTEVQITFCDRDTADIYFNQSLYYGAVEENEIPPITITTVTAVSLNLPITYSILPPKSGNYFDISETVSAYYIIQIRLVLTFYNVLQHKIMQGTINTTMMLDREERETYTLIVKAMDSAPTPNTAYSTV